MGLNTKQITQLIKMMETIQTLLTDAVRSGSSSDGRLRIGSARPRRRGAELDTFQKLVLSERKAGASVAELAVKHGITVSYIYQMERRER